MSKTELGAFLQARRAAVPPSAVGIPDTGRRRRVSGLRREEVAALVGLSTDYYVRLEQGRAARPSESVIEAIAATLLLDEPQREHLRHLAQPVRRPPRPAPDHVDAATRTLLDTLTVPALVMTANTQVIGWNTCACAVFTDFSGRPSRERNAAWLLFCDTDVATRHRNWEASARDTVGMLRMAGGRNPEDPDLTALIRDLSLRSAAFRRYWNEHHVYEKSTGLTQLSHPDVGDLDLTFIAWRAPATPNQFLVTYTPEAGSPSARALERLRADQDGNLIIDAYISTISR
ncbi:helix-turn-helix transcriptional regulator [Mycolicibacterium smegmatis]|uniref:helix-turn-helix transcriptional regulator n=1 Tax=Mycolicibacterium smegmatis TaxID=1772 RepID=UPI0009B765B2|nr:helix-turn-helix transcriptional regulator [Mycolicibacterium smegmatis]